MPGIYATSRAEAGGKFRGSTYGGRGRSAALYVVGVVRDDGSRGKGDNAAVIRDTAGSVNSN